MIVKLLTENHLESLSFKGGCRGLSESTLVKMSNCWQWRAAAQITVRSGRNTVLQNGCTVVAVLLHLIYLVVFLSMLAEGVLHGRMVLLPLNRNPIAKKMLIAVWGM